MAQSRKYKHLFSLQKCKPNCPPKMNHPLIIDENQTNQQILSHYALRWGMNVHSFSSLPDVKSWLASEKTADIIVLNRRTLMNQDGKFDLSQIQPEIKFTRDPQPVPKTNILVGSIPTILFTAYDANINRYQGIEIARTLTIPIKPVPFLHTLVDLLEGKVVPQQKTISLSQNDTPLAQKHPLSILVAEDNLVNQRVALLMLERLGYKADVVLTGVAVLEALKRRRYDIILMDIQMPEMDGVEATRRIRQAWSPSEQPQIVAMTANALPGDKERYYAEGMVAYISKPIRLEDLQSVLTSCQPRSQLLRDAVANGDMHPNHEENDLPN
ncbi:response regulator [Chloroflexi bacterium TSY]|nr:response regulator [Chloroflexi bacterium TSY]